VGGGAKRLGSPAPREVFQRGHWHSQPGGDEWRAGTDDPRHGGGGGGGGGRDEVNFARHVQCADSPLCPGEPVRLSQPEWTNSVMSPPSPAPPGPKSATARNTRHEGRIHTLRRIPPAAGPRKRSCPVKAPVAVPTGGRPQLG